jgi:prephenate dehydrogenase
MHFHKVAILGVGLIGASFALAMKKNNLCTFISGFGRQRENLQRAQEMGIIDSFEQDASDACREADLIVFATPVGSFLNIAQQTGPSYKKGALITDVGSVKGTLVRDMENLMPEGVSFVGGHPIAGSDRSGINSASADLFSGAKCILTPTAKTDRESLSAVTNIWKTFGSVVKLIGAEEHDRMYAAVSHLPHLIAYEIVNTVADIDSSYLNFSGKGFLDTTRIASSHPELWRDICILNRENLLEAIEVFQQNLKRVSQYLSARDSETLEEDFKRARKLREGIGKN